MSGSDAIPRREIAHRLFAAEYDDASLEHSESDEERAPNYVITPTGARVNRLFVAGVLTAVERVNDDTLRGRIVDPTGAFVVYAGQYQPEALTALERLEAPSFVAVTGKANTFQPEDSDRVFTSIRPESINEVDADTRDRWVVDAAEATLDRVGRMAGALEADLGGQALLDALREAGVDEEDARGVVLALDHYDSGPAYLEALRERALDAVGVVTGDVEEVEPLSTDPDAIGDASAAALATVALAGPAEVPGESDDGAPAATADTPGDESGARVDEEPATTEVDPDAATGDAERETPDTEDDPDPASAGDSAAGDDGTDRASGATAGEGSVPEEPASGGGSSLGNFETDSSDEGPTDADPSSADDPADAPSDEEVTDELYEFDEEERERIESEYGTEFSTGTEVADPGEADIETPTGPAGESAPRSGSEDDPGRTVDDAVEGVGDADEGVGDADEGVGDADEGAGDADEGAGDADDGDGSAEVDGADGSDDEDTSVDDVLLETMRDLDDGDGAERTALVDAVVDRTGADESTVSDAIEDALMSGQCYEPDDEHIKPI